MVSAPRHWAALLALALGIGACTSSRQATSPYEPSRASVGHQPDRRYDATDYGLDLEVDPLRHEVRGEVRMSFTATAPMDRVSLDAVDMRILAVHTDPRLERGFSAAVGADGAQWSYDGRVLTVPLRRGLKRGESGFVSVRYEAQPRAGFYFVDPDRKGVEHVPHVFTQGECDDSRFWFPCNDTPADRASHSIRAVLPAEWISVAAGEIVERELSEGQRVVTWRMEEEMPPYLFTFAAGPFALVEDAWEDVAVRYVVEPGDEAAARASLGETPAVLAFLSEYTSFRYPWTKYDTTAVRDFPFGGMENVTATTITRNALASEPYVDEFPAWGLVAHEAAHQWFGDIVTCESWSHAWLNEGLATFFGNLYGRERNGEAAFLQAMGAQIDRYTAACRGEKRRALVKSEYRAPFDLFFDGTIYPGGATRMNLLRGWVGEAAFRAAIGRYLRDNAYRSVDSRALQRAFEQETGEGFADFWAQWIYGVGYPEVRVRWWTDRDGALWLDVRQVHEVVQAGSLADSAPGAFRFPLDVQFHDGSTWRESRVWISRRDQRVSIVGAGAVQAVAIDPHAYVPARWEVEEPRAATEFRVVGSRSGRDRVLAIRSLAQQGDDASLFWAAAEGDSDPVVRREAILALDGRVGLEDVDRFVANFRGETEVGPRNAWLQRIAGFADVPAARLILSDALAEQPGSPGAKAIALRAFAERLSGDDLYGLLVQWADVESPKQVLRKTAFGLLAERLPDARSLAFLASQAAAGRPTVVRQAALESLDPWVAESEPAALALARAALLDASPLIRRAAAGHVGNHPRLFPEALPDAMAVETDVRARRLLEQGMPAPDPDALAWSQPRPGSRSNRALPPMVLGPDPAKAAPTPPLPPPASSDPPAAPGGVDLNDPETLAALRKELGELQGRLAQLEALASETEAIRARLQQIAELLDGSPQGR